ncbi:sulfite exporter TauE/SafE family protein [soil metagenome]
MAGVLEPSVLVVAGLAIMTGAIVQGTVGFGTGLFAAPVLAIADPRLVPGTLLLIILVLPMLFATREIRGADWRGLRWSLAGRLPGAALGAFAVTALSARALAIGVAIVVLAAVALSLSVWSPRISPPALFTAGVISGVTGTATSIGGPPIALLYQHASGPRIRATLSVYFVVGGIISAVALFLAGGIGAFELHAAALLLPFMLGGFLVSGPLRRYLDRGWTRPAVLGLSASAAVALLLRSVL